LYPPKRRMGTVHPAAERWLPKLRRPRPFEALAALAWWFLRAPVTLITSVTMVVAGYARRPTLLVRALATVALAAAHARSLSALRVDHLHAHTATYPVLAVWLCHRLTGVPYSFTPHGQDLYVDQSFLRRRLREAEFVVAISDFNRGFLAAYGADRVTPAPLVRCGIELPAYTFNPRTPAPTGPVNALCVGSLKDPKGQHILFEALAGPDASGLDRIHLDLVGDGPHREALEALAARLGIAPRVTFHGALPEPRVNEFLDRADLFVLPSIVTANGTTEGLPVSLMEALAAGLPVIASRVAGVPELIREGETGILAEPGDPDDLRRALRALLADPEGARERVEAGRALVERDYDVRRSGAALAGLFLGRRAARPEPAARNGEADQAPVREATLSE
jgi:colanic acid/amylovoran biosynthesis glycosyltransferase